jgi:O-antigen/teichoic acid export membrane protein
MIKQYYLEYSQVIKDVFFSLLSSFIIVIATNFFLNPFLARNFTDVSYGLVLSSMAFIALLSNIFGNTLNNVKLLQYNKLKNNHNNFLILLITATFIGLVIFLVIDIFSIQSPSFTLFLLCLFLLFATLKNYVLVYLRIRISYQKLFVSNLLTSLSYLTVFFLNNFALYWPIPYLLGEIAAFIFIIISRKSIKESIKVDEDFRLVVKPFMFLIFSSLVLNLFTYFDRIFLFPLLGSEYVTIYTISTFYSKISTILVGPIASIILTYVTQKSYRHSTKNIIFTIFLTAILSVVFFITIPLFGNLITNFLYPQFFDSAKNYLVLGSLGILIGNFPILLNPYILMYSKPKNQIWINLTTLGIYMFSSYFLISNLSFLGFYIAVMITNTYRTIFILVIVYLNRFNINQSMSIE